MVSILQNGNVGIGTENPTAKLDVAGYNILGNGIANSHFPWSGDGWAYVSGKGIVFRSDAAGEYAERMRIADNGNIGIGTSEPRTPLHVLGRISTGADHTSAGAITFFPPDGKAWFHIDNGPAGRPTDKPGRLRISAGVNPGDDEFVSILQDGRVGIGTTAPQHKLSVKGTVQSTEVVVVAPQDFPDFVFEDGYKLMSLTELEKYISQHGHLPGVPSAEEVDEKGLHVGETQAQLLQKIEELTLYVIDLKKENETLKERVEALER
jgi:hypothetical protein